MCEMSPQGRTELGKGNYWKQRLIDFFSRYCVYRWFCHFDDDNYVNVPRLLEILSNYNPKKDWYLGKPSIRTPLEILDKEYQSINKIRVSSLSLFVYKVRLTVNIADDGKISQLFLLINWASAFEINT